jgi:hypothetical protein
VARAILALACLLGMAAAAAVVARPETLLAVVSASTDAAVRAAAISLATPVTVSAALGAVLAGTAGLLRGGGAAASLGLILVVADVAIAHRDVNPTAPTAFLHARPPVLGALPARDHSRVFVYDYMAGGARPSPRPYQVRYAGGDPRLAASLALRSYLLPPLGMAWGVYGSFDVNLLALDSPHVARLRDALLGSEGTPGFVRLLQVSGVSRVVALHADGFEGLTPVAELPSAFTAGPIRVFQVPSPRARVYAVSGARRVDDESALALLTAGSVDPAREVLLGSGGPPVRRPGRAESVRLLRLAADRLVAEVELSQDGYLVFVENHDPAWQARVDGRPSPVLRANVAFLATPVPQGRHQVELRYAPNSVRLGVAVSGAGALAAATGLLLRPRRGPLAGSRPMQ